MAVKSEGPGVTDGLLEIEPDAGERHLILAKVIEDVSDAMKKLLASGLNRKAIIVLIHDATPAATYAHPKISKKAIGDVLDALQALKDRYCR